MSDNYSLYYTASYLFLASILYYGLSVSTLKALEKAKRLMDEGKKDEFDRYMSRCIFIKYVRLIRTIKTFLTKK